MQTPAGGGGEKTQKKYKKSKIQKNYKNKNCFVFGKITGPGFLLQRQENIKNVYMNQKMNER